jgi:hypothetical protein
MRLASVSVDLDPIACYYRIHGLGPAPAALADVIWTRAVPRFIEVLGRAGVRGTFFVVTSDLDRPAARAGVRALREAGHELGNHSHVHAYDLGRWPLEQVRPELTRAHELLGEALGEAPRGFRAPGYDLSPAMLEALIELGYQYDSSIFPAPAYYAAKATVMAGLAAVGRPSGAVLTEPRALVAPIDPYRPARKKPWRRGMAPLLELPVAVSRFTRLPLIGTNLLLAPAVLRRRLVRGLGTRPHFNFELHGIDLVDAQADAMPAALVARQPDLRRPLAAKRAALAAILGETERAWVPLAEVAL